MLKFQLTHFPRTVSARQLLADLRRVSREHGLHIVTQRQYDKFGKFKHRRFYNRFGSWMNAQEAAGLEKTRHMVLAGEELFENLKKVWTKLGRQPKLREMQRPLSKFKGSVYVNIFGTWWRALEWFVRLANSPSCHSRARGNLCKSKRKTPASLPSQSPPYQGGDREGVSFHLPTFHQYQKRSRWISTRLRYEVLRRDRYKCRLCGRSPMTHKRTILHLDHKKPLAKGGKTTLSNLQTLCGKCNIGKADN